MRYEDRRNPVDGAGQRSALEGTPDEINSVDILQFLADEQVTI